MTLPTISQKDFDKLLDEYTKHLNSRLHRQSYIIAQCIIIERELKEKYSYISKC